MFQAIVGIVKDVPVVMADVTNTGGVTTPMGV